MVYIYIYTEPVVLYTVVVVVVYSESGATFDGKRARGLILSVIHTHTRAHTKEATEKERRERENGHL